LETEAPCSKQPSNCAAEQVMEGAAAKLWTAELRTAITEELKVQVVEKDGDLKQKLFQLEGRCMTIAGKLERLVSVKYAYAEKELDEQLGGKKSKAQKEVKDLLTKIGTKTGRKLVGLVAGKNGEAKVNFEELLEEVDADAGNSKLETLLNEIGAEIGSKFTKPASQVENQAKTSEEEDRNTVKQEADSCQDEGKTEITSKFKEQPNKVEQEKAKKSEKTEEARNFEKLGNPWIFGIISIIVIVLAVLLALLFNVRGHSTNGERYREDFEAKVAKLQHQFPNQNHVLWNALRRLGSEHIVEYFNTSSSEPSRPLVFVLVSTPDNSEELNCFSEGVATAFLNKGDYGVLDGSNITRRSQSKPDVDEDIERRLKSSSTYPVLLVKDLGSLPYDVASVFFKYCDNEDAPYPQAIFIFTLTIDGDNSVLSSSTRKEITSKSYEYLTTVAWKDADKAKTDALIARIVNPYPLSVIKEDSSMLKEVC